MSDLYIAMDLISITVQNYRSITKAYKLPLINYSVFVGPNNEGKSNILRALGLSLSLLTGSGRVHRTKYRTTLRYHYRNTDRFDFNWMRDFPVNLQKSKPKGTSNITLEFKFTDVELTEFKKKIKVSLSTNLKVKFLIGKDDVVFDVPIQGKGKLNFTSKREEIADFIKARLVAKYVPAIRTSELALSIVESLLDQELQQLEKDPKFSLLQKELDKLKKPIIDSISKNLTSTVAKFIPDVKKITIENRISLTNMLSAQSALMVDDGVRTELSSKGDGVISLTSLSMIRHASEQSLGNKRLVLLVEEPESHLHPNAIHGLKSVLQDISEKHQVIISTHSPIIVNRNVVRGNIIVSNNKARAATQLHEIRDSLGIQLSDNLSSAHLVVLVEGSEDTKMLESWIRKMSSKINSSLSNGTLMFDDLGGASNLNYKASFYRQSLCRVQAYMDNDEDGRRAVQKSMDKGTLDSSEYTLSSCPGMANSEIEDLVTLATYRQNIIDEYGVDLNIPRFKKSSPKWSDRVKEIFKLNGKLWSNKIENDVKRIVANRVQENGLESLNPHLKSSVENLVQQLEKTLEKT